MERGRSRGEGAPLPWTQELAGVGLHRKQKVNMSECLFIISLDGVSNPQRVSVQPTLVDVVVS